MAAGSALPRGGQIYQDWAILVDLGESAEWIAGCSAASFAERLCRRHGLGLETLLSRSEAFGAPRSAARPSRRCDLAGTYVCYSRAWSSYYPQHLLPGVLTIRATAGGEALRGDYAENLPIGRLGLSGPVSGGERVLTVHLADAESGMQLMLWLFMPTPPMTVLAGFITGTTFMSTKPQLCASRMIAFRMPPEAAPDLPTVGYMKPGASIAADLALRGLAVASADALDHAAATYLAGSGDGSLDRVTAEDHQDLAELLDRQWLTSGLGSQLSRSTPSPLGTIR